MSNIDPVSTPSTDIVGDWLEQDRQRRTLVEAIRPANKAALFDALAGAGITTVVLQFDGCGDSGQVESIEAKIGDNIVDLPDTKIELAQSRWGSSEVELCTPPAGSRATKSRRSPRASIHPLPSSAA